MSKRPISGERTDFGIDAEEFVHSLIFEALEEGYDAEAISKALRKLAVSDINYLLEIAQSKRKNGDHD